MLLSSHGQLQVAHLRTRSAASPRANITMTVNDAQYPPSTAPSMCIVACTAVAGVITREHLRDAPTATQHDIPPSPRDRVCSNMTGRRVPGTLRSANMTGRSCFCVPMSDMCPNVIVIKGMSDIQTEFHLHRVMPGMKDWLHSNRHLSDMQIMTLSPCIRSHVGSKKQSRSVTCPGQRAHLELSRFETCPGQYAHSSSCRLDTCPGQCAQSRRPETCPGQRALNSLGRTATCPGQRARKFPQQVDTCSEQCPATTTRSNCPGQRPSRMAQSRDYDAKIDDTLEELKFWTMSLGCRNLRDCIRDVPANHRCLDCSQSDWWKEPGISERRKVLRELTTCEYTHVVDTRCLRDTEGSASRHLGTHIINMRGMCWNANMKGLIKDVWTRIEDLLREAYKHVKPGRRVDVALGFVCNSGRHRSVCVSEMTTAVLARLGICTDVDHLCQSDWKHLCGRDEAPCPACDFVATEKPWAPYFDWFYVEMMKCAQKRGCQHEDWWLHFSLPDIDQLPRVELPPIEDNRPGSYQMPKDSSQGASTRRSTRGEPKERPRAKSGGSPGATPRHSQAASTTAADVRHPTPEEPENTERARHVKVEGDGSEATREAGRLCRRARGEKSPSGDWTGLPGFLGPPRAKSIGRKGPRTSPREGLILTQQREMSMGRRGPRIRPRDEDVGGHPADSPPASRQRMSGHAINWFMKNMERAFANMDNQQLNRVSETLNTEMDIRENADENTNRPRGARAGSRAASGAEETAPERPRGGRNASRAGRDRSRPPPGGADAEEEAEDQQQEAEPGSRTRSRSKAVTRRRAQWRADHGLPPREEEWAQEAEERAAAAAQEQEAEVELGEADFGTDSPPRGAARWRHGGHKSDHVPRAAEPDLPVSYDSPGVARPGEGRLRVIGDSEVPAIPNVPALPDDAQPMARLRDCFGMHERAYPPRVMKALRDLVETKPKNVSLSEDNGYWMPQGSRFEVKVCPRDSAVPTDWRHRWSKKWTWSLWPMGNVPGTWIWMIDEDCVAPSDMHVWPREGTSENM